jgi:hypothetical protein
MKPDASFIEVRDADVTPEHAEFRSRCSHCRSITSLMPKTSFFGEKSKVQDDLPPSTGVLLARQEREAWEKRGSPVVDRPYVYVNGFVVRGRTFDYKM